jgi:hypothetical protein
VQITGVVDGGEILTVCGIAIHCGTWQVE